MAKTSLIMKQQAAPKFKSRAYSRCKQCGRPRGLFRQLPAWPNFLPERALKGEGPGVIKASW
jgi:small subunit ribosomal protein S14